MNKSVLDKLSKFESNVELAEVKVDLANINQLVTILKNAEKNLSEFNKLYEQATSLKDKIVPLGNKVVEAQKEMNALAGTFEKQFSELGLKFSDYPEYKNVSNFMNRSAMVTDMIGYIRQI
jgi:hypothetical protein